MFKFSSYSKHLKFISITDRVLLLIIILPFIIISFFNNPTGDDYWLSALVKKYGFFEAQSILYNTVSSRFTALTFMSFNPLVFNNVTLFKIIPVTFLFLLIYSFSFLLRNLFQSNKLIAYKKTDIYLLSSAFIATYLVVLPGIGEGIYWTSSLAVYQIGILLFTLWLVALLKWYHHRVQTWYNFLISCICLTGIMGCNEILASLAFIVNILFFLHFFIFRRRLDVLSFTGLIITTICLVYILHSNGVQTRFTSRNTNDSKLVYSIGIGILGVAYYSLKCLSNPFFWILLIISYKPFSRFSSHFYNNTDALFRYSRPILMLWIFFMITIEVFPIYITGDIHPPLRVSNMMVFFFLLGVIYLGMIISTNRSNHLRLINQLTKFKKARLYLLFALLIAGFSLRNNVSTALREIVSGKASLYDKEMKNRYKLLSQCTSDTCYIPVLKYRPVTLRYAEFDNDMHIGEFYNKKIVYIGN